MISDPTFIDINGWHVAITANDFMFQMIRSDKSKSMAGDRFTRVSIHIDPSFCLKFMVFGVKIWLFKLATNLLHARTMMPIQPVAEGVAVDFIRSVFIRMAPGQNKCPSLNVIQNIRF